MIAADERRKLLGVPLCGARVVLRLESISVEGLADLRGRDPWELMWEINLQAGRPIWHAPKALAALQNLIDAPSRRARALPLARASPAMRRPPTANQAARAAAVSREDLGFLLAKATQRWNELLAERFAAAGFGEVRPSCGSVLLPLYEQDGLRMGDLARRAHLSKQTMTELIRRLERDGLIERRSDPSDARASLIFLTARSRRFEPVAAAVLAELDRLAQGRLGPRRVTELKAALAELVHLG